MDRYRAKAVKQTSFRAGHEKKGGRTKGSENKITTTVKEAILEAIAKYGKDGKGREGMIGYFLSMCEDKALMCRLIEKIMPTQVTGKDGGAIQVFTLPPELLKGLSSEELGALEAVLSKIGSGHLQQTMAAPGGGRAESYAKEIGLDTNATKH